MRCARAVALLGVLSSMQGCSTDQSVLHAASDAAEDVLAMAWIIFAGGAVIFGLVIALVALAMYGPQRLRSVLAKDGFILGGGLVFPVVTLAVLLGYGMLLTTHGMHGSPDGPLRITVIGEQWWWRLEYATADGVRFDSANELRIPAGRPVQLALKTADVIHSFWTPNLAGKLDMIPGRTNMLTLNAARPGVYRGQCAEYCGGAHALMALLVVALPEEEFALWLAGQAGQAEPPREALAQRGRLLFERNGCGGCHTIRGTSANGIIGPDLTHVGQRETIAAATLANTIPNLVYWIRHNQEIKPDNHMLPFVGMETRDATAIAHYLSGLK
jgi:cytochrome c oxidase subunit II